MIRTLIVLAAVTAIPTPKPPELCEPIPVMDSYQCPGTDVNYVFTLKVGCDKPVLAFHACNVVEDEAGVRPAPLSCDAPGADAEFCIDAAFDEHSPDGPGEGPEGAGPVDKPDLPEPAP